MLQRHEEYRPYLLEHLFEVTLTHWEPVMRDMGAAALRGICEVDLVQLGPPCAIRAVGLSLKYSHNSMLNCVRSQN